MCDLEKGLVHIPAVWDDKPVVNEPETVALLDVWHCYDLGSDFSARLLTGYDYGTPKASSRISHGQSYQSA